MKLKGKDIIKLGFTKCNNSHRKNKLGTKIKYFIVYK